MIVSFVVPIVFQYNFSQKTKFFLRQGVEKRHERRQDKTKFGEKVEFMVYK